MTTSRVKRYAAVLTTTTLVALGLTVAVGSQAASADPLPSPPQIQQRNSSVVTADPLPTIQLDSGYVWAQTTIGTTVYAAGSFSNARAAGTAAGGATTPRSNILAYDITTGALNMTFAPTVNGVIKSIARSHDGTRIYIGGSFTTVNGATRYNFAAVNAVTGALIPAFAPSVGGSGVYGITVSPDDSVVYLGGLFTQANATARKNLAAFQTSNGALLAWAPTTDLQVDGMTTDPVNGNPVAAGRFATVNSVTQRGLVELDKSDGSINANWAAPNTVINGASTGANAGKAGIFGVTADSTNVYGTGWVYADVATGNLEGVFSAYGGTGDIKWIADCHGDHYAIFSTGTTVYSTSHTHQCDTVGLAPEQPTRTYRYAEAFTTAVGGTLSRSPSVSNIYKDWSGTPAPSPYAWYPDFTVGTASGLGQAGLSITGTPDGNYISVGGEFGSVNNRQFYGLVRFSTTPAGGALQGPRIAAASWTPTVTSKSAGTVRVTVPANWDRDDLTLTYSLYRQGTAAAVDSKVVDSTWFNQPGISVSLKDSGQTPGAALNYRVIVKDGDGNNVTSAWVPVTVANGVPSAYGDQVLDDSAQIYYRLGNDTTDWAGGPNPVFGAGVTTVTPGATADGDSSASVFSGAANSIVTTSTTRPAPAQFSVEAWFKTNTTRGGKLVGYGDLATGTSNNYDRHIYMQNNGKLTFGVYPGSVATVNSSASYNDNNWHHVVGTEGTDGIKLYVDGTLVGSDPTVTTAQSYAGYWRIGGDNLGGWPNQPSNTYFVGSIDDVAIYPSALSASTVALHTALGHGTAAPTAAFTSTPTGLTAAFDASTSSAPSGRTITDYSWDFGDSSAAGTGSTPSHTYAATGTYQVKLTITDSIGLKDTVTNAVTVTAPNVPPVASFTSTTSGLTVNVNAGASTDPDGTIASYSWNWGDGTAAGSGVTASHPYSHAGTFPVTVTVTDDKGAPTTSAVTNVVVTHAAPVAKFSTTVTGLTAAVDATLSTASDGGTLTYSWNWGDGTANGSGVTATHAYAAAGPETITLTVTDNYGSTGSATANLSPSTQTIAARDDFGRTTASGWGTADVGGAYTVLYGSAAAATVNGSQGVIALTPGNTRTLMLPSASVRDSSSTVQFSLDQAPSAGSSYVGLIARQGTGADDNYTVRTWLNSNGTTWLVIQRGGTVLKSLQLPAASNWAAGTAFNFRVDVSGVSPTTISAKVWKVGTTEPVAFQLTTTDTTANLQNAGYVGVHAARSASATTTGIFTFDSFAVVDTSNTPPPVNAAPTAAFTSNVTFLQVAFDGTGSSDSDGTIASYSWDFGDGTALGSGSKPVHTYTTAGPYQVKLTVTDNGGKTGTVTHPVTAIQPPVTTFFVQDDFERTATGGWGSADAGGAYNVLYGSATSASVTGGKGVLTLTPGNTRNLMLQAASARDTTATIAFSLDQAPASGGSYVGLIARQQAGADDNYTVRTWLNANGTTWLVIQRGPTVLKSLQLPAALNWSANTVFNLRVDVTGVSPTTITAKLWAGAGVAEPATAAQLTTTDATAQLQTAGYAGVHAARSGSATTTGVFSFDTFRVTKIN